MRQAKQLVLILVSMVSLVWTGNAWGFEKIQINYDHPDQLEWACLQSEDSEVVQVYGEVIAINQDELTIRTANGTNTGQINPDTRIYCNGMRASWEALLPVTSEAFFEARVVLKRGLVLAVDGFYFGEEVCIQGWEYCGGQLKLKLFSLCRETSETYWLNPRARLPQRQDWLRVNQNVFVLYAAEGTIRAVYD